MVRTSAAKKHPKWARYCKMLYANTYKSTPQMFSGKPSLPTGLQTHSPLVLMHPTDPANSLKTTTSSGPGDKFFLQVKPLPALMGKPLTVPLLLANIPPPKWRDYYLANLI